jgi:hypothetical protein
VIRTAFGKVALLALTTAMAAGAVVGCSGDVTDKPASGGVVADGKHGQVGLNLVPVSGVTINVVSYKVTQGAGGAVVKSGNLPVPGTASEFSFGVPLPVGTGYVLSLEAVSTDGKVTCAGGAGPFNVTANQTIDITPTLTCTDITTGQTASTVEVTTSACPDISFDYVIATPKGTDVGKSISLLSNATSASSATLKYSWKLATASVGTFSNPLIKDTSLHCDAQGDNVKVTVTADNGECTKSLSTTVSCANVLCGNGVLDAGETCDKALDPACPADCTAQCGDGVVEYHETCEPPNTAACKADCTARPASCSDGFVTPPEACDPTATPNGAPAGATCNADCTVSQPASCGDGIVTAPETCDNPGGDNYAIANCGDSWGAGSKNDCQVITSASCASCEAGSECAELTDPAILSTAARKELFWKTLDCVRDTGCATGLALDCYCGTVSSAQCDAGNGNGVCKSIIEASLETTNPTEIVNRFSNPTLGGGLALALIACDKNNCVSQCGL